MNSTALRKSTPTRSRRDAQLEAARRIARLRRLRRSGSVACQPGHPAAVVKDLDGYSEWFWPDRIEGDANNPLNALYAAHRRELSRHIAVDPGSSSVIRTPSGLTVRIPAGAFVAPGGGRVRDVVHVTVVELIKQADTVLADRPTTSGSELLETGGSFFFGAQAGGQVLGLNQPVQATVPVSPLVRAEEMMRMYRGIGQAGVFDWLEVPGKPGEIKTINETFKVSIPRPGWVNCDHRFRLAMQPRYEVDLPLDSGLEQMDVFFLYRTINTTAKLQRSERGTFTLPNRVPLPAIVYGIGASGDQYYQGFHFFDQNPRGIPRPMKDPFAFDLEMAPVDKGAIKGNLERKIAEWDTTVVGRPLRELAERRRRVGPDNVV